MKEVPQFISNLSPVARIDAQDRRWRAHLQIRKRIEKVKGCFHLRKKEQIRVSSSKVTARLVITYCI